MNDKPATPKLAAALVASLADLCVIEKKHRADAGSYSYDFADLADTVLDTRPVLAKNGVVALTPVHAYGTGLAVTVMFLHESGERMDCDPLPFPAGQNAQATGSMITYHRRYALTAALGMATGEDDDGAAAIARQEPQEDPAVPGLRSSIEAAIEKLDDTGKDELKAWFAENNLPAVRRCNATQCDRIIAHLLEPGEAAA